MPNTTNTPIATPETTATNTAGTLDANTATRPDFGRSARAVSESVTDTRPPSDSVPALVSHMTQAGHSQHAMSLIACINDEHHESRSVRQCHDREDSLTVPHGGFSHVCRPEPSPPTQTAHVGTYGQRGRLTDSTGTSPGRTGLIGFGPPYGGIHAEVDQSASRNLLTDTQPTQLPTSSSSAELSSGIGPPTRCSDTEHQTSHQQAATGTVAYVPDRSLGEP